MTTERYSTTAQMLADHPHLRVTAIRYRLAWLLGTNREDAAYSEPETAALVERWHVLQKAEANRRTTSDRHSDRRTVAHRHQMRAFKRREAARCPVIFTRSA